MKGSLGTLATLVKTTGVACFLDNPLSTVLPHLALEAFDGVQYTAGVARFCAIPYLPFFPIWL